MIRFGLSHVLWTKIRFILENPILNDSFSQSRFSDNKFGHLRTELLIWLTGWQNVNIPLFSTHHISLLKRVHIHFSFLSTFRFNHDMTSADWKCIALALGATVLLLAVALVAVTVNWVLSARSTRAAMEALMATVRIRNTRTPNGRYKKPPPPPPGNLYTEVEVTPL